MSIVPFLLLAAAPLQAAAPAPPAGPPATAVSDDQRIAQASAIGQLLYLFDRAAWVSTDALSAAVPKDRLAGPGGYVVEAEGDVLRVTYYRGTASDAQAFFTADVRGGTVIRQALLAQPVALTPRQLRYARARDVAEAQARQRQYKPCTAAPFNTVVLPSQNDGPIAVYLLSAQTSTTSFPLGGNFRVVVGTDGSVLGARPYSVACLNMVLPKLPAGATPVGMAVTHLLDPVPTEVHVFASLSMKMPLFVGTRDGRVWQVKGTAISLAKGL